MPLSEYSSLHDLRVHAYIMEQNREDRGREPPPVQRRDGMPQRPSVSIAVDTDNAGLRFHVWLEPTLGVSCSARVAQSSAEAGSEFNNAVQP